MRPVTQLLQTRRTLRTALIAMLIAGCSEAPEQTSAPPPVPAASVAADYVGSEACRDCHAAEHAAWLNSHHDLALQPATPDTILATGSGNHEGTRFEIEGGRLTISPDPDTRLTPRFTFGIAPLQQYVVDGDNGAWQTYPIAWDSRPGSEGGQRWFNLHDDVYPAGDPMHWQGRANRWNSQCADCHSTGVTKNYDPAERSYETTLEVEDVGCEACHGPGSLHLADPAAQPLLRTGAQPEEIDTCAGCHSRRSQIAEGFRPGLPYYDFYSPRLLEPGLYHVDGQILEEVYVWGSFLSSRMHRSGVTCTDCHDPHSARLERPGDDTCTFCHQVRPPAEFAAAGGRDFASPDHHFHPPDSEGARCVACHMPSRTYMGVDDRRDHSFRIPRPDLSLTLGVPEPCTGCHTDKTHAWAATVLEEHSGRQRPDHFAATFAAADGAEPGADAALAAMVSDTTNPIMVRASALARLGAYDRGYTLDAIRLARRDEPLLRYAAPLAAASLSPDRSWRLLTPLLTDELRAVRHAAVMALLPTLGADPAYRDRLAPHLEAWIADQSFNLDYPETLTNLAGAYLAMGDPQAAEAALNESLALQASWIPGLLSLADLYRVTGRDPEGGRLLEQALALSEAQPEVAYAFALWLIRQGRREEALEKLALAASGAPDQRRYAYTWAVALNDSGDPAQAISVLESLLERWPDDADLLFAAVTMLRDQGRFSEALVYLDRLLRVRPDDEQLMRFRQALQQAVNAA